MSSVGATRETVRFAGGRIIPAREFLADFRTRKFVPSLTQTLRLFKPKGVDREYGARFLAEARVIVDGLLHHSNTTLASVAASTSEFISQELTALGPQPGSSGSQDSSNGSDVTRARIDQLLQAQLPGEISIPNRRAVVAQKKELIDCAKLEAAHRTAEVGAKTKALDTYLEQAKILPEEAQIDEPLTVETAPGVYAHFTITGVLGEGGMAKVFLAEDQSGRQVALKVLLEGFAGLEREFLSEGQRMQKLDHPNIVKGYGVGHLHPGSGKPQRPFFVMELMGAPLNSLEIVRPLTPDQKLAVAYKSAVALDHAYSQPEKIVHRDVKLANILITRNATGELLAIKISDFGLSLALNEIANNSSHTRTGTVKGTFTHLAPEIVEIANTHGPERIHKLEAAGPQADIYAWAIAMYQLHALRLPPERDFSGDATKWYQFALAKGEDSKKYELAKPAGISDQLWSIIVKATRLDPAERYKSWAELLRDLTPLIPPAERQQPEGDKTQVSIPSQITELVVLMSKVHSSEVQLAPAAVLELRQKLGETLAGLEAKEALATEEIGFIATALDFAPRLQVMIDKLQVQV